MEKTNGNVAVRRCWRTLLSPEVADATLYIVHVSAMGLVAATVLRHETNWINAPSIPRERTKIPCYCSLFHLVIASENSEPSIATCPPRVSSSMRDTFPSAFVHA